MGTLRRVRSVPILGPIAESLGRRVRNIRFKGSAAYWEQRYRDGGHSGAGSYNRLREFKARVLNDFVAKNCIQTVIEFGSGDGSQLLLAEYPSYTGIDVSPTAIASARALFSSDNRKTFYLSSDTPTSLSAELCLSLDVIYHLVEDGVFEAYMMALFDAAQRFVIIYSSDVDCRKTAPHVRHRQFTKWVAHFRPEFVLSEIVPNAFPFDKDNPDETSFADFYIFERSHHL